VEVYASASSSATEAPTLVLLPLGSPATETAAGYTLVARTTAWPAKGPWPMLADAVPPVHPRTLYAPQTRHRA
jgi:hypothetical protein